MKKSLFMKVGAIAAAAVMLFGNGTVLASSGSQNAAIKAADYLKTQIHDDGGFGSPNSTVVSTAISIMAYKTAGVKIPAAKSGKTPLDYLKTTAPTLNDPSQEIVIQNAASIAHVIIAVKVAGLDPKNFAGIDWIALLHSAGSQATGSYGRQEIDEIWAMLALETAGEQVTVNSVSRLKNNQEENGGYALDKKGGMGSDTNTTALAIQALIGAGEKKTDPSIKKALAFLKTQQNNDGGFPFVTPSPYGTDSDSSSTAWVIQALVSAGEDIEGKAWVKTSITPIGFLMSLQNSDGGFMFQKAVPDSNLLSTNQAVPALMLKPFPYKATVENAATKVKAADSKSQLWLYLGLAAIVVLVAILGFFVVRKRG